MVSKFSDQRPVHSLFSAQVDVSKKSAKYVKSKARGAVEKKRY